MGLETRNWLYREEVLHQFRESGSARLVEFLSQAADREAHPEYYRPERFPLVYAARQYFSYPPVKVAQFLGRTASAITYAERRVQRKLRERPELEQHLKQIIMKL